MQPPRTLRLIVAIALLAAMACAGFKASYAHEYQLTPGTVNLTATTGSISNGGTLAGNAVNIQAGLDINNQGGAILGLGTDSTVRLNAGRDITIQSIKVDTNSVTSAQNKYGTNLIAFDSTQVTNVTTFPKPPLAPKFGRTGP